MRQVERAHGSAIRCCSALEGKRLCAARPHSSWLLDKPCRGLGLSLAEGRALDLGRHKTKSSVRIMHTHPISIHTSRNISKSLWLWSDGLSAVHGELVCGLVRSRCERVGSEYSFAFEGIVLCLCAVCSSWRYLRGLEKGTLSFWYSLSFSRADSARSRHLRRSTSRSRSTPKISRVRANCEQTKKGYVLVSLLFNRVSSLLAVKPFDV